MQYESDKEIDINFDFDLILKEAQVSVKNIIKDAILYTDDHKAVIVYDDNSQLSPLLLNLYKEALPQATLVDFDKAQQDDILELFDSLELNSKARLPSIFSQSIMVCNGPFAERTMIALP